MRKADYEKRDRGVECKSEGQKEITFRVFRLTPRYLKPFFA